MVYFKGYYRAQKLFAKGRDIIPRHNKKKLGILGGMGPAATVFFYQLITERTFAERDRDHLNIIITSRADTPDRTDFILGKSKDDPLPSMLADARTLEGAGADVIAVPCNTAQFFWDRLTAGVGVPILNIVEETAEYAARRGFRRAALLATEGTVKSGLYLRALADRGIECTAPGREDQTLVDSIIYDYVKAGVPGGDVLFRRVAEKMLAANCDCIILGCTELPLVAPSAPYIIDSLEVLAYRSIVEAGGTPKGFSPEFLAAYEKSYEKI